jgi:hypothetical protein
MGVGDVNFCRIIFLDLMHRHIYMHNYLKLYNLFSLLIIVFDTL